MLWFSRICTRTVHYSQVCITNVNIWKLLVRSLQKFFNISDSVCFQILDLQQKNIVLLSCPKIEISKLICHSLRDLFTMCTNIHLEMLYNVHWCHSEAVLQCALHCIRTKKEKEKEKWHSQEHSNLHLTSLYSYFLSRGNKGDEWTVAIHPKDFHVLFIR